METVHNYKDNPITFSLTKDKNVMINATEMAKPFNKKVEAFVRNESTESFIQAVLKSENSRFLNVTTREDLIQSRQKSGTYMHRILALKFAAWLDPFFEVWVYSTIDELLFGSYKEDEASYKEIARIQSEITQKQKELEENPVLKEIEALRKSELKERRKVDIRKKARISDFRSMFTTEEMNGESEK